MTYTYKLGNNGPTAEVDDHIKITKEEYKEGFSGAGEWKLNITRQRPGSSSGSEGIFTVRKGVVGADGIRLKW